MAITAALERLLPHAAGARSTTSAGRRSSAPDPREAG
jgi:hypothetical protein